MNYVDNTFKSPAVISFCPGILGIERGLERAGTKCRVAAYVEIEAFICANLVTGMEAGLLDPAPIWTNAKTFDARPFCGRIHGIIGGYPCPGESLAGLREGHLYKGFIWPDIRRSIAAARPLFCFFENVDDHLTGTYPIVQRSLRNMGYAVEAGVYTAEEVGAPHERKRIFILAIADSLRHGRQYASRFLAEIIGMHQSMEELADPNSQQQQIGELQKGFQKCQTSAGSSEELGHSEKQRPQEYGIIADQITKTKSEQRRRRLESGIAGSGANQWPAGQGVYQHDWEEPRTVESGLGCTINGYNFKSDLVRALGNSVVEQQAEIAWIDLLKKHFKNL